MPPEEDRAMVTVDPHTKFREDRSTVFKSNMSFGVLVVSKNTQLFDFVTECQW